MKTEVIIKRELFNMPISQKSKSEFFSATELVMAGNVWRLKNQQRAFSLSSYFQNKSTKEFMEALSRKYGKVIIKSRGGNQHTWVHPLLFIDIALAISPELKIEVYEWLFDHLIRFRNNSGDSFKKMAGSLFLNSKSKSTFREEIQYISNQIKLACKCNDWNEATEEQLRMRDDMHKSISLLCSVLKNNDDAVRLGIREHLK